MCVSNQFLSSRNKERAVVATTAAVEVMIIAAAVAVDITAAKKK